MKFIYASVAAAALITLSSMGGEAKSLGRDYSNDEQTLCQPDVFRLCNDYVPDEDRIVVCMKAKRSQLSPECRKVFDAGIKKRVQ